MFFLLTFCKCNLFDYSIIDDSLGGASGGSTHGLRNHLKNFHKKKFLDMQHEEEMILCVRVYWICHSICLISHPRLCFIAFKMKSYCRPGTQSSGRVGYLKKKKFGTGRALGSCRTLVMTYNIYSINMQQIGRIFGEKKRRILRITTG